MIYSDTHTIIVVAINRDMEVMNKTLFLIFLFMFIYGCEQNTHSSIYINEKYPLNPNKRDFTRTNINVTMFIYEDIESLNKGIAKYPSHDVTVIRLGLAVWSEDNNRCDIHVLEPKNQGDIDTWGHELMHCVYGNWH